MILRPVSPASPIGPPMTKRPVGLTCITGSSARSSRGMTGRITASMMSARSRSARTSGSCWVETTTVRTRFGMPCSYSTVTWVLPSGRRPAAGRSCGPRRGGAPSGARARSAAASARASRGRRTRTSSPGRRRRAPAPGRHLADLEGVVDAHGDVRRLLLDRHERAAGLVVEAVLGRRCSRCRGPCRGRSTGSRRRSSW